MSVTETVPFFPIYKVGVFPITRRTVSLSSSIRYTCGIVSAASVVSFAANAVAGTAPISIHAARNVAIQRNPFIFILFLSSWLFYFSYLCQLSIFLRLFQNFVVILTFPLSGVLLLPQLSLFALLLPDS